MAFAPTLVPRPDMTPVPRVEVTFPSVHASAERATVYRLAAGRTFRVRGAINIYAAGGFSLVDTECPFTPATYRAEMFDASGVSLGLTDPTSTTLQFEGTVLHQPLDPTRAVLVEVEKGTASEVVQRSRGEWANPQGRTLPVWVGFGSGGAEDVPLRLVTRTVEAEAAFRSIFGEVEDPQIPIACFRSSLPLGLPEPFFALMQSRTRLPFNTRTGGETVIWSSQGTEVAPPAEALLTALLSYGDIEGSFGAYTAAEAAYLTYLAVESDYSKAGVV